MTVNAQVLSAGDSLDLLRRGWEAQASGGLAASWMLHGRPGVGKSQIVQQLADQIDARLFDLRLTTIEPQDLRGLPYYDHETRKTVWYRPEDLPDDPTSPAILFLDELTAAAPSLQPTVYGLLQERRVGQHRLPGSVMIVAAGNTVEDGAVAYEMGTALSDRLIHVLVQADARDWLERYAAPKGLDPAVTAFLRSRPDLLDTTEACLRRGDMIACTPRAWERTSDILRAVEDRRARDAMLAGTLGREVAADFIVVAEEVRSSLHVDALLEAEKDARAELFPDTLHGLNAVVFALVGRAEKSNLAPVIDTLEQIRHLAKLRSEAVYSALPLAELCAYGFEMLLARALREGWQEAFATSPAYARYRTDRAAIGLD